MMLPVLFLLLLPSQVPDLIRVQNQAPAVPAIVKDPKYQLRVQVAETGSNGNGGKMNGYGHGNVLGPPAEGFDFTQDCNQRFSSRPEADQYFRARWTKQGQRLEVLIQEMGSDRIVACELKVAMQEQPYDLNLSRMGVRVSTLPRPAVPVLEPDPNFPLRLQLWITSFGGINMTTHMEGYGNVIGPPAQGFDFADTCPVRLTTGKNKTDVYQARWVEQGLKLEILLQEVGSPQENVCAMDVGMKSAPYPVPEPGAKLVPPVAAPKTTSPQAPTSNSNLPPP